MPAGGACGGIRYAVRGELEDVINCHCERCRQFTGHHMAATSARLEDVDVEDAESLLLVLPRARGGLRLLFWLWIVTVLAVRG